MNQILDIPEIRSLDACRHVIRIPDQIDVPLTPRVQRLIDTPAFRRLSHISQLGLVSLVYPAAHHSRFEHSLGVYRMVLLFLKRLAHDERFAATVSAADTEKLIVAALLHDLGHWPFCHPIEDIELPDVPEHEVFARRFLQDSELSDLLQHDWNIRADDIAALLTEKSEFDSLRILQSILSGPIDVDKMDYLYRDSLHAGVPYGRNFDQQRLIASLCLNSSGTGLAITDKGRTAAEMMVFARYVMFSEVYWHHTVRTATAMLQRAFFEMHQSLDFETLFTRTDADWIMELRQIAANRPAAGLLDGLFGRTRCLYKRLTQFSIYENRPFYERLARRPYPWLVRCTEHLAELLDEQFGLSISPTDLLIDAPPVKLEVQFDVEVFFAKEGCYRKMEEVSPVVRALAREQFDDYVKRVRIFVHPRVAKTLQDGCDLEQTLDSAISRTS